MLQMIPLVKLGNSDLDLLHRLTKDTLCPMYCAVDEIACTLSELTRRLAADASQQRHDLVLRRLRHWSLAGALRTAGQLHTGTGRARRFEAEEVYIAAVLLRLADWGLPIGALKAVAETIRLEIDKVGETAGLWAEAKRRSLEGHTVFAGLSVKLDDAGEKPVSIGIRLKHGQRLNTPRFLLDHEDSIIVLNLTEVFASVKLL
jgi:hypothetical protein